MVTPSEVEVKSLIGDCSEWAVLTGAGFSADWGVPTSDQFWAHLISDAEVQGSQELRDLLLKTTSLNFEERIGHAREQLCEQTVAQLIGAVQRTFGLIHQNFVESYEDDWHHGFHEFLDYLKPKSGEVSFIFTLNLDMVFEAYTGAGYGGGSLIRPFLNPTSAAKGIKERIQNTNFPNGELMSRNLSNLRDCQCYVKLHGSWDWKVGTDRTMVLGDMKDRAIGEEPILRTYQSLFAEFLDHPDRRLLIIGYSFGDFHINELLAKAVKEKNLRVHIWDRMSPSDMHLRLSRSAEGQIIWPGLCGYTSTSVKKTLRPSHSDQRETYEAARILKAIFGPK